MFICWRLKARSIQRKSYIVAAEEGFWALRWVFGDGAEGVDRA